MEDTVQSEGPVESFPVSSPSSVMEGTEGWSVVSHVQTDFTVLPGASQKECCGHPALGAHALLWYLLTLVSAYLGVTLPFHSKWGPSLHLTDSSPPMLMPSPFFLSTHPGVLVRM